MNDLISKLSEIRSNYNCFDETEEPYYRALSEAIQLASAQPEQGDEAIFWKKRAREYEDIVADFVAEQAKGIKFDSITITEEGITFKKSQPERTGQKMTNAEAIETLIANYPDACFEQLREAVDAAIEALKAQPERTGKWIGYNTEQDGWKRTDGSPVFMSCSECNGLVLNNGSAHWNYCPNCGARMEGNDETD